MGKFDMLSVGNGVVFFLIKKTFIRHGDFWKGWEGGRIMNSSLFIRNVS